MNDEESDNTRPVIGTSVDVDAPPGEVWRHIIDGSLASEWLGGEITLEPRRGGAIHFQPGDVPHLGTVEEIDEERSITWSWRHPDRDPTQVTIDLEPIDEGTRVTVTERMLPYQITQVPAITTEGRQIRWTQFAAA